MNRRYALGLLVLALTSLTQELQAQVSKQIEKIPLREYANRESYSRNDGITSYYYDKEHDLDKFVGVWEGVSHNGYQLRAELSIIKRRISPWNQADILALSLLVWKDGKLIPSSLDLDDEYHKNLGQWPSPKPNTTSQEIDPSCYYMPLGFGSDENTPYNGCHMTNWQINEKQDTILVWTEGSFGIEGALHLPDYARPTKRSLPMWTLHRVK